MITALQAGMPWVRFPMGSLGFFTDLILPAAFMALGSTQSPKGMRTRDIFWGVNEAGA